MSPQPAKRLERVAIRRSRSENEYLEWPTGGTSYVQCFVGVAHRVGGQPPGRKLLQQQAATERMIIDNQDAEAGEPRREASEGFRAADRRHAGGKSKRAPPTRLALCGDRAVHKGGQPADDCEPESGAPEMAMRLRRPLLERVEYARQAVAFDADAGVGNLDLQAACGRF